jgi:hypothetical protein
MNARRLVLGSLVLLACSRLSQDAGIVLNVDTDVTSDRSVMDHLAVTVDGHRQEWILTRPLPGSLGLKTSPGMRSVTVEGFRNTSLLGSWSGTIATSKGSVMVQDVHLACAGCARLDAGPSQDSGPGSLDSGRLDAGVGGVTGTGGMAGGSGGNTGRDTALDTGDVPALVDVSGTRDARPAGDGASDGAAESTALLNGAFSVSSQFQIPATAAAPGPVGDTLRLVHRLVDDPAAAILSFADDAGVPGLSTLRSALPDVLESKLTGWMNAYIKTASVGGVSPYDQIVAMDQLIQSLLLNWGLQSRLTLPLGAPGTHAPVSLSFASSSNPVVIPLDATASVTSATDVTATVSWPGGPNGAAVVTISDHTMGLPFGRYALQALNAILLSQYGAANLAAYLSSAIGCPGMAKSVASQCVSVVITDVCVGHESDLLAVCEAGLSEAAKQIEDQIRGLDLKAIHCLSGTATAIGASLSRPQDATALDNGLWTVTVDFGSGAQPATATFSATAETSAP